MRKLLIAILTLLLLVGCAPKEEEKTSTIIKSTDPGDYDILIPFDASPIRYNHGIYLGDIDLLDIGSRLQEHSKTVFSVNDHYLAEGQILTITRVNNLLKREDSDNPYGLNPPKGSEFDSGVNNVKIQDAVLVADIMEIDFYSGSQSSPTLSGMSLAVIFNQTFDVNGLSVTISDEKLSEYAQTAGRKLERYLRTIPGMENITIYISLYTTQKIDSTLPGHFFSEATFTNREGQFEPVIEEWVFFPSTAALSKDIQNSTAFNTMRSAIVDFTPESLGTVGEGLYRDGELNHLKITVSMQAKTYTEVYALTQTIVDLLEGFNHEKYDIIVKVESNFDTVALIELTQDDVLSVVITH
jgi:protein involved in sex pheromone biosynthesis